jgi:hypothetical protein
MQTSSPGSRLTGGCRCGAVRYELADAPHETCICHCQECQKQSASAFGISVMVRSANVRRLTGKLECWSRATDSRRTPACYFCATCGTRLWHGDKDRAEEISIKGGTFDEPVDLRRAIHIWTRRKLPGVLIPDDAQQFPGEPE